MVDIGQGHFKILEGQRYRVVGKIRSVGATDDGQPKIIFTGIEARISPTVDRNKLEALAPDQYVIVDCQYPRRDKNEAVFAILDDCTSIEQLPALSADEYKAEYDKNMFHADSLYKEQTIVVYGITRLVDNLATGQRYLSFSTENGFSDVVGIIALEDLSLVPGYAKKRDAAVMVCKGGKRWNSVGSIGLDECHFLTNY